MISLTVNGKKFEVDAHSGVPTEIFKMAIKMTIVLFSGSVFTTLNNVRS